MYLNIFFLILVLLLSNFGPVDNASIPWSSSPEITFFASLGIYFLTLCLICLQNRLLQRFFQRNYDWLAVLANIELIICLAIMEFVLGFQIIFNTNTWQSLTTFFFLGLYLLGLVVFYRTLPLKKSSLREFRLIIPFALPFLILVVFFDLLPLIPNARFQNFLENGLDSVAGSFFMLGSTLLLMGAMMIFLPYFIQKIWQCKPLNNPELEKSLNQVCERARFKYAGFKTWTIMNHALTAAIIGIVPQFRYILFTKRLLNEMPEDSIKAILAHEIGHNYYRHLLKYPFVIMGMSVALAYFIWFFSTVWTTFFNDLNASFPSSLWGLFYPIMLFFTYAVVIALYFRLVFGLFSRHFERQADLHVFKLGVNPQSMINALDYIGTSTGNSHHVKNWHHYGIQERIDFLHQAIANPSIIEKHHRR